MEKDNIKYKHGKGIFTINEEEYDCQWDNDVMKGLGICKYASGDVYEVKI